MHIISSLVLAVLFTATAAGAQPRLAEFLKDSMPNALTSSTAVAAGDLDGDGLVDLIFANGSLTRSEDQAFRNLGNGRFEDRSAAWLPGFDEITLDARIADLDGDGDNDAVLAAEPTSRLLLNDGTGVLVDATANLGSAPRAGTVVVLDADGDGDPDLVFSSARGIETALYRNDGTGNFARIAGSFAPSVFPVSNLGAGDVDRDGDLDIVAAASDGTNSDQLFLNDGSGRFTAVAPSPFQGQRCASTGLALGDVDGDGDLDVALANAYTLGSGGPHVNQLYLGDGLGSFTEVTATHMPSLRHDSYSVQLGDVDGDGDLDLVFGNSGKDTVYLNDGSGFFSDATAERMDPWTVATNQLILRDLDGDGDLDAALAVGGFIPSRNLVLYNTHGVFYDSMQGLFPYRGEAGAIADVNGDGAPDIVRAEFSCLTILFGRRGYRFSTPVVSNQSNFTGESEIVDVDDDGDLDIMIATGPPPGLGFHPRQRGGRAGGPRR